VFYIYPFKALVKRKKCSYKLQQNRELESMRRKKPRDFWKFVRKKKSGNMHETQVSGEQFFEYFSKLESEIKTVSNRNIDNFVQCNNFAAVDDCIFDDFDSVITVEEVITAVSKLSKCKSPGIDGLVNEYFIEGVDVLAPYLCKLFNSIFNSGVFPDDWSKGLLVPLHKKGSKADVNNYRGITLVSYLTKLFQLY
jgi:hypothetical protein